LADSRNSRRIRGARKIVKELANPFQISEDMINISASIGITLSSENTSTPEDLMKNADLAMYAAKSAGRNRVGFFSPNQKSPSTRIQKSQSH
jgi:diguanylate cyclase (GGDEF)-like protein